jgi:S1-C subfamily serine protease
MMRNLSMSRKLLGALVVLIASLAVSACTLKYDAVGSFDDYGAVFEGSVSVSIGGTGTLTLHEVGGSISCTGSTWVNYQPGGLTKQGARGGALIECSDGRIADVARVQSTEDGGTGRGTDQNGNKLRFRYDLDHRVLANYRKTLISQTAQKPELPPVYDPKETRKERGFATGTGFFVSNDGIFVTNHHVIEDAEQVAIRLEGEEEIYPARILAQDPANDIAIGKVDLVSVAIPVNIFEMSKGEEIMALGYPGIAIMGNEQKATFGRINALSAMQDDIRYYQMDVPIQPGNSGGPVINSRGEVIGIATAVMNQELAVLAMGTLAQNVNFAMKSGYILPIAQSKRLKIQLASDSPEMSMVDIIRKFERSVFLVISK